MLPFAVLAAAAAAAQVTVPPQPQLTEQVRQADAELFRLFFEAPCDVPRFRALLADDVEFYHDKDGFSIRNAGRARFAMVWALGSDGRWRPSRVLSFGHAAAN